MTKELQANELRIGNYFKAKGKLYQVEYLAKNSVSGKTINLDKNFSEGFLDSQVQPIELTEEILLKCGFIKDKIDTTFYNNDFIIDLPNYFVYKESNLLKIKHLHQLQNLYFALTNTELTFK